VAGMAVIQSDDLHVTVVLADTNVRS